MHKLIQSKIFWIFENIWKISYRNFQKLYLFIFLIHWQKYSFKSLFHCKIKNMNFKVHYRIIVSNYFIYFLCDLMWRYLRKTTGSRRNTLMAVWHNYTKLPVIVWFYWFWPGVFDWPLIVGCCTRAVKLDYPSLSNSRSIFIFTRATQCANSLIFRPAFFLYFFKWCTT